MGREHGELHARGGEHLERLAVDSGLRQPEACRSAAKPAPEVVDAPADLGFLVTTARERKDDVVVRRGERVPVIGVEHVLVDRGGFALHPVQQGRPKIEAQLPVQRQERLIRLPRDADVPVVVRRGRRLGIDLSGPGVLARRLIEMPVNDDEAFFSCAHPTTSATVRSTSGNTPSCAPSASTRCMVASSILPFFNARTRSSAWPQCSSNR